MIHDQIRKTLNESMGAVMACRAAKNSIVLWQRRYTRARDAKQKLVARRMINKKRLKVQRCKRRGLMI